MLEHTIKEKYFRELYGRLFDMRYSLLSYARKASPVHTNIPALVIKAYRPLEMNCIYIFSVIEVVTLSKHLSANVTQCNQQPFTVLRKCRVIVNSKERTAEVKSKTVSFYIDCPSLTYLKNFSWLPLLRIYCLVFRREA